jgi:hypothetical protein
MSTHSKQAHPRPIHKQLWVPIFSLRTVGYILLLLAIVDAVDSLVPPEFMNPNWEFATIGKFVERSPVSLIGLGLVFYRGKRFRRRLERALLKPICVLAIGIGILYCLTIPLTLGDGMRLQEQSVEQAGQARSQQLAQLKTLEKSIQTASVAQLQRLATTIDAQKVLGLPTSEPALRADLISRLQTVRDNNLQQSAEVTRKRLLTLRKTVAKWVIGALLAGIGFIYLGYVSWRFV